MVRSVTELDVVLCVAENEVFEDGKESELSRQLASLIEQFGSDAVRAVSTMIFSGKVSGEVAAVALQTMGEIQHCPSHRPRLLLLTKALEHSSEWVRDGAGIGLDLLGDSLAVPYLTRAIEQEPYEELRRNLVVIRDCLKGRE